MARNKTKEQATKELFDDLNFKIDSSESESVKLKDRPDDATPVSELLPIAVRSKHVQLLMYPQLHAKALAEAKRQRKSLNRYIEDLLAKELGEDISTY